MDDLEKRKEKFLALSRPVNKTNDEITNQNQIGSLDFLPVVQENIETAKKFNAREARKARKLIQIINDL